MSSFQLSSIIFKGDVETQTIPEYKAVALWKNIRNGERGGSEAMLSSALAIQYEIGSRSDLFLKQSGTNTHHDICGWWWWWWWGRHGMRPYWLAEFWRASRIFWSSSPEQGLIFKWFYRRAIIASLIVKFILKTTMLQNWTGIEDIILHFTPHDSRFGGTFTPPQVPVKLIGYYRESWLLSVYCHCARLGIIVLD